MCLPRKPEPPVMMMRWFDQLTGVAEGIFWVPEWG